MEKKTEKEYLKLAGTYLACRWEVMGHTVEGGPFRPSNDINRLEYSMLGMHDSAWEMELILYEISQLNAAKDLSAHPSC